MPRPSRAPRVRPFFNVVSTAEARAHIAEVDALPSEWVATRMAAERVLAQPIAAAIDMPHFDRADMDGFAVRSADTFGASTGTPGYLKILGTVEMGRHARTKVRKGTAMRVATGAMLPPGADAVVMVEHTDEVGELVEVHRGVSPWQNVLRIGEDVARGTAVLPAGRRLRARDLGALTGLGVTKVRVHRRPCVGLLSTGDEIVSPDRKPRPGQVRNINQYSLAAMIEATGAQVTDYGVVADATADLAAALRRALAKNDAVFLSGGSSVGVKDLTTDVILSLPKAKIVFHGISVAPGKPTLFAMAGGVPIVGLPGHPVSALVIFDLFGAPLLRLLAGESADSAFRPARSERATLAQNVASKPGREDYVRVRLRRNGERTLATPMPGKSGAIFHLISADGLVRIPANSEGLDQGTEVDVIVF
jgi:molybdopterin molybdotransferase